VRCPEGRSKHCFYQKHVKDGTPDVIHPVPIQEDDGIKDYMAVDDLDGLIALVQLGVLEVHTWGCRRDAVDRPDQMILDLDPDESLPWQAVVDAAFELRRRLEAIDLVSFVKTTGGKGLHVVVPVTSRPGWDELKELTHQIALALVRAEPHRYLATMSKRERKGKIFIDYLRNGQGASAIGPYSTRAREGAPVATPITWEELEDGVDPSAFTVLTVPRRVATQKRDPWRDYATTRQSITASMRKSLASSR
jgi:bifunctional non-homologous end joining protein LigD